MRELGVVTEKTGAFCLTLNWEDLTQQQHLEGNARKEAADNEEVIKYPEKAHLPCICLHLTSNLPTVLWASMFF